MALDNYCTKLEAEIERLNTWDGLMSLVDEHYPSDIFDGSSGDPGPRMVVLLREVGLSREERDAAVMRATKAEAEIERLKAALAQYADLDNWNSVHEPSYLYDHFIGTNDGWEIAHKALGRE